MVVGDGGDSGWTLLGETEYLSGEGGLDALDLICTELQFPAAEDVSNIEFFRGGHFRTEDGVFGIALPLAEKKIESELDGNPQLGGRVGDLSRET